MKPQPTGVLCSYGHGRYGENVGYYVAIEKKECYSAIENIFKSDWKSIVLMTSNAKKITTCSLDPLFFCCWFEKFFKIVLY